MATFTSPVYMIVDRSLNRHEKGDRPRFAAIGSNWLEPKVEADSRAEIEDALLDAGFVQDGIYWRREVA